MQGAGQDRLGIYIKSVVAGGAADAVSNCYLFEKITQYTYNIQNACFVFRLFTNS